MMPQTNPEATRVAQATDAFEITRYIAAAPDLVFDAWVGDEWAQWLPYPHAVVLIHEIDTRPGGHYQLALQLSDGQTLTVSGTYHEVIRPTNLVFTWLSSLAEHDSLISVTFHPSGDGTLMTLRQEGLPIPEVLANHRQGWIGAFDRLQTQVRRPHRAS